MNEIKPQANEFIIKAYIKTGFYGFVIPKKNFGTWKYSSSHIDNTSINREVFYKSFDLTSSIEVVEDSLLDLNLIIDSYFLTDLIPREVAGFEILGIEKISDNLTNRLILLLGQPLSQEQFSKADFYRTNPLVLSLYFSSDPKNFKIEEVIEIYNILRAKEKNIQKNIFMFRQGIMDINEGVQSPLFNLDKYIVNSSTLIVSALENLLTNDSTSEVGFKFSFFGTWLYEKNVPVDFFSRFKLDIVKKLNFDEMNTNLQFLYTFRSHFVHGSIEMSKDTKKNLRKMQGSLNISTQSQLKLDYAFVLISFYPHLLAILKYSIKDLPFEAKNYLKEIL